MKILSLDTAMAACSAAVIDSTEREPVAHAFTAMERGQAEALPPMVAGVMSRSGLGFDDIDRIAVTIGPGTFTGVRIGLSFARGLGLARGIPVVGIDTLSAIAANESGEQPLLVVADARNEEVYAAVFDSSRMIIAGPKLANASQAADGAPQGSLILGSGARKVAAASNRLDLMSSASGDLPVAAVFGRLAMGLPTGASSAPLYLRAPDAKPHSTPSPRKPFTWAIEDVGSSAAPLLAALHAETFADGWNAAAFEDLLRTPGTRASIAVESGEPLAFLLTRQAADEAEILAIGTRLGAQRRGLAQHLLFRQLDKLKADGLRQVFLEVAVSNTPARALYAKAGFAEAGRRKGYYRRRDGHEDALILRKELAP